MKISRLTDESAAQKFDPIGRGICAKGNFIVSKAKGNIVIDIEAVDGKYAVRVADIIDEIINKTNPKEDE